MKRGEVERFLVDMKYIRAQLGHQPANGREVVEVMPAVEANLFAWNFDGTAL